MGGLFAFFLIVSTVLTMLTIIGIPITFIILALRKRYKTKESTYQAPQQHPNAPPSGTGIIYRKVRLITKNEERNVSAIREAAKTFQLYVFSKVRLIDIVNTHNPRNAGAVNKIIRKHVDFLLCDRNYMPVCVIEIDDFTHRTIGAQKRDAVKDMALADAGVPILRAYTVTQSDLEYKLNGLLHPQQQAQHARE